MKCPRCNEKIKATESNCPYCGYSISESSNMFINPIISPEIEDKRTNARKEQDAYLQNNRFSSGKNWVKRYETIIKNELSKSRLSAAIVLVVLVALFISIIISTKEYIIIVPLIFFGGTMGFILVSLFKRKFYEVRDYEKYTILVYQKKNQAIIVIDDVEIMKYTITSYPFEMNTFIPGTKIPVKVIAKPMEFMIKVNNEA